MKPISVKQIVLATGGALCCGDENQQVFEIVIDSRAETKNGLFVPIVGEKSDGHNYIKGAVENGATCVFLAATYANKQEILEQLEKCTVAVVEVEDTVAALQRLASWYRDCFKVPIIGITGSVGKTTTKEMVSAALETKKKVLKTLGNKNSQIGLPLMMFYLDDSYDLAVIEMGMSEFGEMKRLCDVAKPECAVMTNIGVAHIAQLKTQENIRKEKIAICNHFVTGSKLFLNGNDTLLHETAIEITHKSITIDCSNETREKLLQAEAVTYGIGTEYDFSAVNLITTEKGISFDVMFEEYGEKRNYPVALSVYGEHNVMNALAAIAVARHYGIAVEDAIRGLESYQPIAMRGQIITKDGITWIDDTYNASPDSMKSGAKVLLSLNQAKRRIAVLADVLELGDKSEELHRGVGSFLADLTTEAGKIDVVLTVGEQAAFIADEIKKKNETIVCKSFFSNVQAITNLKEMLKEGDAVLVKGSRGMKTDEIVAAFLKK